MSSRLLPDPLNCVVARNKNRDFAYCRITVDGDFFLQKTVVVLVFRILVPVHIFRALADEVA